MSLVCCWALEQLLPGKSSFSRRPKHFQHLPLLSFSPLFTAAAQALDSLEEKGKQFSPRAQGLLQPKKAKEWRWVLIMWMHWVQ